MINTEFEEIWKDIIDYEKLYQVSNKGNIKSIIGNHSKTTRNRNSIRKIKNLKFNINDRGYLVVGLTKNKIRKRFKVSRLVATHFVENPDNKPEVNHKDGNKLNNNFWNLEWNTRSENVKHAYDNGLIDKKTKALLCRSLTNKQELEIVNKFVPYKYTTSMLANEYKVSSSLIKKILFIKYK